MAGLQHDDVDLAGFAKATLSEKASHESDVVSTLSHDDDGVHAGLEFPSEHEKETLRRVGDDVPWNAYSEFSPRRCNHHRMLIHVPQ